MNSTHSLHADFNLAVMDAAADCIWHPSPARGVSRRLLDRVGGEVARATSVVRYAAGTAFARHVHGGGEEIFVLDGVFSDEHGDYPAGSYLHHPVGSSHAPFSRQGCTILVKLWQCLPDDQHTLLVYTGVFDAASSQSMSTPASPLGIRSDTSSDIMWHLHDAMTGIEVLPLHHFAGVHTALHRWLAHTPVQMLDHAGGFEAYVLAGVWHDQQHTYPVGTWVRLPAGAQQSAFTQNEGALLYVKYGHLTEQRLQQELAYLKNQK